MTYDFACECGRSEERNVPIAERDTQTCGRCRGPMRRLPHFGHVKFIIPRYMRAGHDDGLVMPDDEEGRTKYMQDAYKQHGKWRNDLVPSTEKPKVMFRDAPR